MSAAAKVSVSDCSAAILALSPSISEVSESMPFKASQSAISVSLCSCSLESACINSAFIWASLKCGVLQPVCRSYFPLHLQTTLRYLSVECHIFEPYQLPHSPQQIFIEKGLRLFWFSALGFSFRHLRLHQLPFGFINYPRMAVRDDVLRNLARVFLRLFGKEIDREALLEHSVAAVLFIRQYALDGFILPPCFFPRSRNAGFCQYLRNGVDGFAAHEQPVNESDCFRFFRVDLRQTIWAFSVSEKLSVGHIDLAVGETFPLSPRHIVRYGAALFLRKR